jgi:hypothetical protein
MDYDYLYVENSYIFIDILNQEETIEFDNENDLYLYVYNIHIYNYDLMLEYTEYVNEVLRSNYINALSGCDDCVKNYIQLIEVLYMFFTEFVDRYIYVSESNNIYFTKTLDKINNIIDNLDETIDNMNSEIEMVDSNNQKNNNCRSGYVKYDRNFPSMYITYEFSHNKSFNNQIKEISNHMHSGGIVP